MANSVYDEYALALFDISLNHEETYQDLKAIENLLIDEKIHSFFSSPNISSEVKKETIKNSFINIDKNLLYFLYVLIDNERLLDMSKIIYGYEELLDSKKNIMTFTLESAFDISNEMKDKIKIALRIKYLKLINLNVVINKDLIGGVVLKQKGRIVDASILNKLELLKESLKETRN